MLRKCSPFYSSIKEIEATKKIKIIAENTRKVLIEKYIPMPNWIVKGHEWNFW